jgi:predicted dehydrogenase
VKDKTSHPSAFPSAAIIGAGLMGRWHADAVRRIGGVVSAIVDPDRERAAQLIKTHPKAKAAPDLAAVAAGGLAEVAHICTPPDTHEALAQQALEAGLHALVEKPLTETGEATARLLRLAESRGLLLCPVHQFLFQEGVLRAQKTMEKWGPLLHVDTVICSAGAEPGAQDPDRVAAEILPGALSLIARLLAPPIRKGKWQVQHPADGEVRACASIGEVSVAVLISMHGRPTVNALRLIGKHGTAHVDLFHGFSILERGTVSRGRKIAHPFTQGGATLFSATANLLLRARRREPAYPGLRELIRRFYDAIHTGGQSPIAGAEILDVALLRDQLLAEMRRED